VCNIIVEFDKKRELFKTDVKSKKITSSQVMEEVLAKLPSNEC
jgi:hypothetical protein